MKVWDSGKSHPCLTYVVAGAGLLTVAVSLAARFTWRRSRR